jgi:TPR repeat protein
LNGDGIKQGNFEKATYWAIFAAKFDIGSGFLTLYDLISSGQAVFKNGYGPPGSFDETDMIRPMAEKGDVASEVRLASNLEKRGLLEEAKLWYSMAAEKGDSTAQDALKRLEGGQN